eukprot:scpid32243/ scgid0834/ 
MMQPSTMLETIAGCILPVPATDYPTASVITVFLLKMISLLGIAAYNSVAVTHKQVWMSSGRSQTGKQGHFKLHMPGLTIVTQISVHILLNRRNLEENAGRSANRNAVSGDLDRLRKLHGIIVAAKRYIDGASVAQGSFKYGLVGKRSGVTDGSMPELTLPLSTLISKHSSGTDRGTDGSTQEPPVGQIEGQMDPHKNSFFCYQHARASTLATALG